MSSLEELRKQLAAKDKKAAEVRAQVARESAAATKQQELKNKMQRLTEHEKERAQHVFDKYFNKAGTGKIDADVLVEVSQSVRAMRPITEADAKAAIDALDFDGDGSLNFEEFCQWWIAAVTASPSMSVLRTVLKVREAHESLEKNLVEEAKNSPDTWAPRVDVHHEVTVGDIDDSFEAKSSILLAAHPSTGENVKATIKAAYEKINAAAEEDDEAMGADELEEYLNARNFQGVLTVNLSLNPDAEEEDIETAMELLKAVYEEYNAQDETPVDVKALHNEAAKQIDIYVFVRGPSEANPDAMGDPSTMYLDQLNLDPSEVSFFDSFLVGLELADVDALNVGSDKPLISVTDKARAVVHGSIGNGVVKVFDQMVLQKVLSRDLGSRRARKQFPAFLPLRLLRGANTSHSFRAPSDIVSQAITDFVAFPEAAAIFMNKKDGSAFSDEDVAAVQAEMGDLTSVVNALVQKNLPWQIRLRDFFGLPNLDEVLGEPKEAAMAAVLGDDSHVRKVLHQFINEDDDASMLRLTISDEHVKVCGVNVTDRLNNIPGIEPDMLVAVIDCTSDETMDRDFLALSRAAKLCPSHLGNSVLIAAVNLGDNDKEAVQARALNAISPKLECECFVVEGDDDRIKEFFEEETPEDDDDVDDDGAEQQVLQTLGFALRKVVTGITEVNVTSSLVDAQLQLHSLPLISAVPATQDDLAKLRTESRHTLRGTTKSMSSEEMADLSFDGISKVMKEVVRETRRKIKKARGESDSEVEDDSDVEIAQSQRVHRDPSAMIEDSSSSYCSSEDY